jgi:hypothetical protein
MAFEQRGSGVYYYRKERQGGKVKSVYVGGGLLGALAEELDREAKEDRAFKLRQRKAAAEAMRAIDQASKESWKEIRAAHEAAMIAAGYHKHNRQWRKKRVNKTEQDS